MRQVTHLELQDENTPKRVAFHPSVVGAPSGEDLAFDFSKVANSSRKVLSNAKPGIAAGQNSSIVQKNRSRFERKATPPVSARAKTYPVKGESFLDELKRVSANSETRQPGKITSRWLKESREAAEAENSETDEMEKRMAVSPRKFSVNKITQARTGPPPKTDDFFSELKQWHNEFALRSVEKPSEIKITSTLKPAPQPEEQVVEEEEKEAVIEKDAEEEEQASKKKKKKFWSFSSRSKNKQKSKDEADDSEDLVEPTEKTTPVTQPPSEPEPVQEKSLPKKSESKAEEKTVIPAKEEPVTEEKVETKEPKLEPEETAIAPKSKPKKPVEVYNANIMDSPELQEPEDLISDLLQADSWLAETFFKKNKATVEKIAEGPSAEEVEESATESSDETEEKTVEEESRAETNPSLTETNPSLAESAESSIPSQFGVEKEPWFQKISGMFKEPTASGDYTTEDEDATDQSAADITNQSTTEYTYQSGTVFTERTEDIEKMVEQQVEEWVGKISSFFNKEGKSGPPISVVELDKYEIDKYEAFADEGDEDTIKADDQSWEPAARTMYTRREGEMVDSFDEELREEVDQFLRTQCACLAADFDIHPKIGTEKATMKRMEEYLSEKGMSWYEMASGLFQTSTRSGFGSTDDEAQSAESVGDASGAATTNARTVVSEATVKRTNKDQNASNDINKKPSYDDILLTLDDGTNVIKMKALMDLYPEESQSLVDSYNNKKSQLKTESSSCPDSKSQKTDSAQKKKSKKTKKSGATLFGSLERKQKNKNKKKRG